MLRVTLRFASSKISVYSVDDEPRLGSIVTWALVYLSFSLLPSSLSRSLLGPTRTDSRLNSSNTPTWVRLFSLVASPKQIFVKVNEIFPRVESSSSRAHSADRSLARLIPSE